MPSKAFCWCLGLRLRVGALKVAVAAGVGAAVGGVVVVVVVGGGGGGTAGVEAELVAAPDRILSFLPPLLLQWLQLLPLAVPRVSVLWFGWFYTLGLRVRNSGFGEV